MTPDEFDRTARLWLADGPTELSDRVLDAALVEVHATRQRHARWPANRLVSRFDLLGFATAAAAVVLVAVVAVDLLPGGSGGGPIPTAIATPSPTPTATPRSMSVVSEVSTGLEPGTWVTEGPFLARVTFTIPAGWSGNIGGPYAVFLDRSPTGSASLSFEVFDDVYADPCQPDKGFVSPRPGPTVDDLANALARLPGLDATVPIDVTFGGYRGKHLTLTASTNPADCALPPYRVWELPLGAVNDMSPGERQRLWILDVAGQRLVIDAPETPDETPLAKAEVQAILDSIRIAPRT